jgi:hypothetical protein
MREFNFLSLLVMGAASFFAWNAIAAPAPTHSASADSASQKVHLLNNLPESDLKLVMKIMEARGYKVSSKGLFTESTKTVSITKALADEVDPASVEIQVISLDHKRGSLPKTVFNHKVMTDDVTEALQSLPRPGELPQLGVNQ